MILRVELTVLVELRAMNTNRSNHKIMAWLSPAYPIGSYSFSHGLEHAIESKCVSDEESLFKWLYQILLFGSGRNDAILLANAHRSSEEQLEYLIEFAEAFVGTKERYLETVQLGTAFAKITTSVYGIAIPPCPLPVAVGYASKIENIDLKKLLPLYLHAFVANLISVAVRFIPLGQTDGQKVLSSLFDTIEDIANKTRDLGLEDLCSSCFLHDIDTMKHETMNTRIFRS